MSLKMTDSYAKAYVEILEIINHMGKEYKRKIPSKLLDFFEQNKDMDYNYQLSKRNENRTFLEETISLLAMLELKYWANEEEKAILEKALKENDKQKQPKEKNSVSELFPKKEQEKNIEDVIINDVDIVEYRETIFKRFINKIKSILNIK